MAKKKTTTTALPQRFQPYANQAAAETAIKYGASQSALQDAYNDTTAGYSQGLAAQKQATSSLLGALTAAPGQLDDVYADAGLTPTVLAALAASSPTGARLASEQAAAKAGILQQQAGARAGAVYNVGHLTDQYKQDVGKINSQAQELGTESGEFQQNLLDQLIGTDRSTRHAANLTAKAQQFTADQNAIGDADSLTKGLATSLVSQGVTPVIGSDGSVSIGAPIPGAKSNPASKPKKVATATHSEQAAAETDFSQALTAATGAISAGASPSATLDGLINGYPATPATKGQPIFKPVPDGKGGTKMVREYNQDGTPKVRGGAPGSPAVDGVNPAIAHAALDMATKGYVTPPVVKELHGLGYNVRNLPGVKTFTNRPQHPPGYKPPVTPTISQHHAATTPKKTNAQILGSPGIGGLTGGG